MADTPKRWVNGTTSKSNAQAACAPRSAIPFYLGIRRQPPSSNRYTNRKGSRGRHRGGLDRPPQAEDGSTSRQTRLVGRINITATTARTPNLPTPIPRWERTITILRGLLPALRQAAGMQGAPHTVNNCGGDERPPPSRERRCLRNEGPRIYATSGPLFIRDWRPMTFCE